MHEPPRPISIRENRRAPALRGLLTATAGWRAVYWVNVPIGLVAVVAGRYLLPRTRQFSPPGKFDGPGTVLLVVATSALLLALSAVSGLSLPAWLAALLAVLALAAAAAFIRREARTRHPLIPVRLLRSRPLALGLAGAACGYLALFGPLVLIPQVLTRRAARATDPALGLSVAQLELLSCITEHPGVRPSQLARLLRLAPSSVATLLGGLQSAGYVTRTPGADSDGDRRTVSLDLSEAGAQAVSRWHQVNEDVIRAALAALPHRDRAALRDAAPALRDLTASIDAQAD